MLIFFLGPTSGMSNKHVIDEAACDHITPLKFDVKIINNNKNPFNTYGL